MSRARIGRVALLSACAAVVGASAVVVPSGAAAPSASGPAPTVGALIAPSSPLRGSTDQNGNSLTFQIYANADPTGPSITSVAFQYRTAGGPGGGGTWTTFACWGSDPSTPSIPCTVPDLGNGQYQTPFDTSAVNGSALPNGTYDFQAVVTDSAGDKFTPPSAIVYDLTVSANATFMALASPGSPLTGQIALTATEEVSGAYSPDTVTFLYCLASQNCPANGGWQQVAGAASTDASGNPIWIPASSLTLPDGTYDFSVTAQSSSAPIPFQGGLVSGVLVDNTPPTVSFGANPPTSLGGSSATLTATATDSGSGVAAVKFEVAPAGTSDWTTVGVATSPSSPGGSSYSVSFDPRQFSDGSYDIRAEATDNAGSGPPDSAIDAGVTIATGSRPFAGLTVTNYLPPATNITLLGELPGAQHETWAIGQTNAPPPIVNGQQLVYTNQGNGQVVLLRYTDDTGWEIVDVLRCGDAVGSVPKCNSRADPYPLDRPASNAHMSISGAMTDTGDAWIAVTIPKGGGQFDQLVFHGSAGGSFEYDGTAASTLAQFGPGSATIRLAEAGGTTYGVLYGAPLGDTQEVKSPAGPVSVTANLGFAQLVGSTWYAPHLAPLQLQTQGYSAPSGVSTIALVAADVTGPGTGWAALAESDSSQRVVSTVLARFALDPQRTGDTWTFVRTTGLDALDLAGPFSPNSQQSIIAGAPATVQPDALRTDGNGGMWLQATVNALGGNGGTAGTVIAHLDANGQVMDSWCSGLPRTDFACANQLDLNHPATVPDASLVNSDGDPNDTVATALGGGFLNVYYHGAWTSVPAAGFTGGSQGLSVFADPTDGWIVGANTLGRISASPLPSPLASWPEANRNPLLSVALPPGQSTTDTPGALAVGVNATALHYDATAGWQVDATPPDTHHIELTGVGFAGPSLAFAVGQVGTILRWDGTTWTEDPQSRLVTTKPLNAVAFGSDGQGWAVGAQGTILHWDGTTWSPESLDPADAGKVVTSVAVAGNEVFAIAGGDLIMRAPDGTWGPFTYPGTSFTPPSAASLTLVSGLPDGGVAVAGKSLLMTRTSATAPFAYSPQSFNGIPVALAAFRASTGDVRALVSVAPPIQVRTGPGADVGGFPAGDGDLILETGAGWQDLSRDTPPASQFAASGDGLVQPDPVLAVAAAPDGSHAWAVGGYAGTHSADGIGTDQILQARPTAWFTSAIWRYDAGGSATSTTTAQATVDLPAIPNNVNFAFFSSALCKAQCSAVQNAQPDVNLNAAAQEIATFAQQPGGPAFAMAGGNIHGGIAGGEGADPIDLARVPSLLSPLSGPSGVPTYATYGPRDSVAGTGSDPALPWAEDFRNSPAPFGAGAAPSGITPQGSGDATGPVNKYYAFDVTQNGGTLRVIVLDNSQGSLDAAQSIWLSGQLSQAQAAGLPIVVFAAEPLNTADPGGATDGDAVAAQLAAAGVLAVFTTSGEAGGSSTITNQVAQVPSDVAPGSPQIPEYEGATLTYQQQKNNGVLWYDVSVDTSTNTVNVRGIPVISSLALEPVDGLSVARSSTLSFQAIGRRPQSTIAATPADPTFPGYDQYVGIPASTCSGCIGPSYSFTSSNPVVGDFVAPSGPGSPYPKLTPEGKTIHSSSSGLFCGYNSGTTTVSVTSGLLTSSLPVTVQAGGYGPPCGTVAGGTSSIVIHTPGGTKYQTGPQPGVAPPSPAPTQLVQTLPHIHLPIPAPAPQPAPAAKPAPVPLPAQAPSPILIAPVLLQTGAAPAVPGVPPPIPAPVTPVPPGGATASAQASARREEKARRQAQQSAYVIRPAGTSAADWFYPAVGVLTLLSMLLIAGGVRPRPGRRPAFAELRDPARPRRRDR